MEAQTPWSGYYEVWPATWLTAHTTQFADPGWHYIDKACAQIDPTTWGGSYVTLRNPETGDWSMIVCADKPVTLDVQVAGKLAKGDVHVWKSNEKIQFVEEKLLRLTDSAFTVSLEGNSVYTLSTTTGQKKGAHPAPPPAADFPLPYKEDFESDAAGVIPKYLCDQKGSFETAKRADGKGICLKQIVPKEGIPWGGRAGFPNTVFGDKLWTDYTIQVDVLIAAGKAGKFVEAKASIDGKTVVVWSDAVAKPVAVRFGWRQDADPNLMNKEGLPAPCFRTDKWEK
jgi:galactosylceramidase